MNRYEVISRILNSYEKLMKENNTIPETDNFELSNIGKKIKNTIISEIVVEIPNEMNVDERRIKDSLKNVFFIYLIYNIFSTKRVKKNQKE